MTTISQQITIIFDNGERKTYNFHSSFTELDYIEIQNNFGFNLTRSLIKDGFLK